MTIGQQGADVSFALQFIENHLKNELRLDTIAYHAATSKYHFHRQFHSSIGMTPASYIRKRRLSNAASDLITSDKRILDIALEYRFESQESFTRAFKAMFHMTPGQYRRFIAALIQKREWNSMNRLPKKPEGWTLSGTHPGDYEVGTDLFMTHHGKASGYLRSIRESSEGFATLMQTFKAHAYRDTRWQLSGFLRTERVGGWCGLWMRVDGKEHEIIQFDNMSNRPVTGSTNWTRYSIVLDVPSASESISFGVLLMGEGHVWIDSLQFDKVSDQVPTTNMEAEADLPEHPVNLGFEAIL